MLTTSHMVTSAPSSSLLISKKKPSWKQKKPLLLPLPLFLYLSMTIQSTAQPTGQFRSTVQAVSPHNLLPTPWPTCWAARVEESFDAVQARNSQNSGVLSTLF